MKNLKSKLIAGALLTTLLTTLVSPAYASTAPTLKRLAGIDRYQTANEIAKDGWTTPPSNVILAYGENYPDALASATFAKRYNGPILLTGRDLVSDETMQVIKSLNVRQLYIVGGTAVVSQNVENQLNNAGYLVARVAGTDRYETAVRIAEQVLDSKKIVLTTGDDYADALSVGSIAGIENAVILLTPKDSVPASVKAYLAKHPNTEKTYVIGGTDIISDAVANQFPNVERITGADKYERNINILNRFASSFSADGVCVATGENFADALTGNAYASKNALPLVLLPNGANTSTSQYLTTKAPTKLIAFGGTAVVSNDKLKSYYPDVATNDTPPIPTPTPTPTPPTDDTSKWLSAGEKLNLPLQFWYNGERVNFATNNTPYDTKILVADLASAMGFTYEIVGDKLNFTFKGKTYATDTTSPYVEVKDGAPYIGIDHFIATLYSDKKSWTYGYDPDTGFRWARDPDPAVTVDMVKAMDEMYSVVTPSYCLSTTSVRDNEKEEIKAKAEEITKGLTNDRDKYEAIVLWVAENIYYHYNGEIPNYEEGRSIAYNALKTRVGVCTEFAFLTGALLEAIGIPFRAPETTAHVWVQAYVDGEWLTCDPTFISMNEYRDGEFIKGFLLQKQYLTKSQYTPHLMLLAH